MATMNYNPFRTTTDAWKLKTVLLGTPDSMGVFDYLSILPIAYKPAIHAAKLGNHKKTEWTLWALTRPLELVKLAAAIVLTVAAIPVVLVAALVVAPFALAIMAITAIANWVGSFFGDKNKSYLIIPNDESEPFQRKGRKHSADFDNSDRKKVSTAPTATDGDNHDFDPAVSLDEDSHKSPATTLG